MLEVVPGGQHWNAAGRVLSSVPLVTLRERECYCCDVDIFGTEERCITNSETLSHLQRPESHILRKATNTEIKRLCDRIVREFKPEKIILFGSHAYGKPQWDSDVDLLVIMPFKGRHTRKAIEILDRLNPTTALDLLVRTPLQIEKRLAMGDFFMREIIDRGKVMYEAPHS